MTQCVFCCCCYTHVLSINLLQVQGLFFYFSMSHCNKRYRSEEISPPVEAWRLNKYLNWVQKVNVLFSPIILTLLASDFYNVTILCNNKSRGLLGRFSCKRNFYHFFPKWNVTLYWEFNTGRAKVRKLNTCKKNNRHNLV